MFINLYTTIKDSIQIIFQNFNWVDIPKFAVFNHFALSLGQNWYIGVLKNKKASHNLYKTMPKPTTYFSGPVQ